MTSVVAPPGDRSFPKDLRLRRRREFVEVQSRGFKVSTDPLLALAMPRKGIGGTRVGFTVSRKIGDAVVRNRIRRRLRELFRKGRAQLPAGIDLVLIARPPAAKADFAALSEAFGLIARKLASRFA